MSASIELVEESSIEIPLAELAERDALAIIEWYSRFFYLVFPCPLHPDHYILRAKSYVGIFPLQKGRYIRVVAKVDGLSVWAMLSCVHDISFIDWWPSKIHFDTIEQVFSVFARQLVQRIEMRFHKGLCWDYERRGTRGSVIRGRVIGPDIKDPVKLQYRYVEGGVDCRDNRILLWTLHSIRPMIWPDEIKASINKLYRLLRLEISLDAASVKGIDRRVYNRDRNDYCEMHLLCRFLLERVAPGKDRGGMPTLPLSLNMASLFEECVSSWVLQKSTEQWAIKKQWVLGLEGSQSIRFRIDLALFDRNNNIPLAVIDAKYKLDREPAADDIQQIVAYAVGLGCKAAILVYPHLAVEDFELHVGEITVFAIGVDLSAGKSWKMGKILNEKIAALI